MEIIDFKKGDEHHILELFNIVFKRPMKLSSWYWRFQNNPAGKYMIKLMWEGDQLIGHYAVSPVVLNVNGIKQLSTLSMTTMTHPDFGRRGIFGKLANALYNDLESNYGVKAIWGFPNSNSHYGFIKNLLWKDLGAISHLTKNVDGVIPELSNKINTPETFTNEHALLYKEVTKDFGVSIDRSSEYLNWRYIDNPNANYGIFDYRDTELKATMIAKLYPSSGADIKDIYITECGIPLESISLLQEFISHIIAYYNCAINTVNIWLPIFDKRYIFFEKNRFVISGKPTYIGVRAENSLSNSLNDFRNWYYSYGDSDVY